MWKSLCRITFAIAVHCLQINHHCIVFSTRNRLINFHQSVNTSHIDIGGITKRDGMSKDIIRQKAISVIPHHTPPIKDIIGEKHIRRVNPKAVSII